MWPGSWTLIKLIKLCSLRNIATLLAYQPASIHADLNLSRNLIPYPAKKKQKTTHLHSEGIIESFHPCIRDESQKFSTIKIKTVLTPDENSDPLQPLPPRFHFSRVPHFTSNAGLHIVRKTTLITWRPMTKSKPDKYISAWLNGCLLLLFNSFGFYLKLLLKVLRRLLSRSCCLGFFFHWRFLLHYGNLSVTLHVCQSWWKRMSKQIRVKSYRPMLVSLATTGHEGKRKKINISRLVASGCWKLAML